MGAALGALLGSDVGQKVGPLVGFNVSTTVVSTLTTDWGEMKSCAAADSSRRRREPAVQLSSVVCAMRSEAQSPESTFDWKNALSASLTVWSVEPSSREKSDDAYAVNRIENRAETVSSGSVAFVPFGEHMASMLASLSMLAALDPLCAINASM